MGSEMNSHETTLHCPGEEVKKEKDQHTRYQLQHTNYITAEETWCHLGNHWEMINETLCVVLWNNLYIKNESVRTRTHMFCFTSSHRGEVQARTGLREECSVVATQLAQVDNVTERLTWKSTTRFKQGGRKEQRTSREGKTQGRLSTVVFTHLWTKIQEVKRELEEKNWPGPSWTWKMRQHGQDTESLSLCFQFSLLPTPLCKKMTIYM